GNAQAIGRFPNRDLRENECTSVPDVECAANALAKSNDAHLLCSAGAGGSRRRLDHLADFASAFASPRGIPDIFGRVVGAFLLPGADAIRPGSFINHAAAVFHLARIRLGIFVADFCARKFVKICSSLSVAAVAICFLYIIRPVVLPDVTKMNEALEL